MHYRCGSHVYPEAIADIAARAAVRPATRPASQNQKLFTVGKVAELAVVGSLTPYGLIATDKNADPGTATIPLAATLRSLQVNESVGLVLMVFDSGGGMVAGTPEAAQAVVDLAAKKPVIGFVAGYCCSACFYIASQTTKLFSTPSALIGSCGTIQTVTDTSGLMERLGIKVHAVTTGDVKAVGTPGVEVTQAQLDWLQSYVNEVQRQFDAAVMSGRKLTSQAMQLIRPGQAFPATMARKLNLIDGFAATPEEAVTLAGYGALLK